jgi:uncharacterized paraquat-inducible protein A
MGTILLGMFGLFIIFIFIYYTVMIANNNSRILIEIRDALKHNLQKCSQCDRYFSLQDKECPQCFTKIE